MDIDEFNTAEMKVWDGINGKRLASPPAEAILLLARIMNEISQKLDRVTKPVVKGCRNPFPPHRVIGSIE